MKSDIEMSQKDKQALQRYKSPRFEELAVILPEQITQSTLRQLVANVQSAMSVISEPKQKKLLDGNASPARELDASTLKVGEIRKAHTILKQLMTTSIADASVLVLITNEMHPKILFTRRAAHLSSHAGEVSFAGGKYEVADSNNVVTALREACEETALPPSKVQLVGQLPTQMSKKGLVVRPIVALVEPPITYVPELGEIARIFWGDFEQLIIQPTTDHILPYRMGEQTVLIKTPSWQVDGEVVWGLTGRILASLLHIGFDRKIEWYYKPVEDVEH